MSEALAPHFPPVERVLPHAGHMILLSRVVAHDEKETRCRVDVGGQRHFRREDGTVPAWVGIEYMAQCIAAHAGLDALAGGGAPMVGFLLGARRVAFHTPCYRADQVLEVSARHLRGRVGLGGLAFACALRDASAPGASPLAEGHLNVVLPDDLGPWQNPGVDRSSSGERHG